MSVRGSMRRVERLAERTAPRGYCKCGKPIVVYHDKHRPSAEKPPEGPCPKCGRERHIINIHIVYSKVTNPHAPPEPFPDG